MSTVKTWVGALRLRTLPLAVSGILMGTVLANSFGEFYPQIAVWSVLTAVLLQILSNLANDYGDFMKGTDNDKRLGNMRALQSGIITPKAMLRAIVLLVVLCLVSGITLLYLAADGSFNVSFLLFFLLGIAAIVAAIKYTVGKRAYGYSGLGDVFVFLFFGPVSVIGTFLLHHHFEWDFATEWPIILPAISMGFLSTGVLNTNNIRDIENDRASGKFTIPVKIGLNAAKQYHLVLCIGALILMQLYVCFTYRNTVQLLMAVGFVPIIMQALKVKKMEPSPLFNPLLKQLSLGTFLMVIVFIITESVSWMMYANDAIHTYIVK